MTPQGKRSLATRIVLGPAIILAVFYFLEKTQPLTEVWKPIAMYLAIAVPAFILIDKLKNKGRA